MNDAKKIIIISIIIVSAIVCICIIALFGIKAKNSKIEEKGYIETFESDEEIEYKLEKLKDATRFFSVEEIIKENINKKFIAKDMNFLEGDRIFSFSVYGTIEEQDVYFIVKMDIINMTFSIEELENKYDNINQIQVKEDIKEIKNNGKNEFEFVDITDEQLARMYLEKFLKLESEEPKVAYKLLNEDYKKERFADFKEYQEYLEEYKTIIEEATLSKYSVEYDDDYIEYVLVDNYNNTYTFNVTGVLEYTVKLDNYTIKNKDYKEKYEKLEVEKKVQSNVYMFLQMINTKDYKHAYELLDNNFKKNNWNSLKEFQEYIQKNFFYYNLLSGAKIKKEGDYYIYEATIKQDSSSASETKKMTVIMQLGEDTDFVMSFNIEKIEE